MPVTPTVGVVLRLTWSLGTGVDDDAAVEFRGSDKEIGTEFGEMPSAVGRVRKAITELRKRELVITRPPAGNFIAARG
jgi:hypothetical protein